MHYSLLYSTSSLGQYPGPCSWSLEEGVQLVSPVQPSAPASLLGVMLVAALWSFSQKAAHQKNLTQVDAVHHASQSQESGSGFVL